ncbi:hypothetical protein FACS189449_01910 [Alphaproteobacteria bacterium]|nr:hypothetical protein FACS189449_01910 [Alphaproteobacteria bacterium]
MNKLMLCLLAFCLLGMVETAKTEEIINRYGTMRPSSMYAKVEISDGAVQINRDTLLRIKSKTGKKVLFVGFDQLGAYSGNLKAEGGEIYSDTEGFEGTAFMSMPNSDHLASLQKKEEDANVKYNHLFADFEDLGHWLPDLASNKFDVIVLGGATAEYCRTDKALRDLFGMLNDGSAIIMPQSCTSGIFNLPHDWLVKEWGQIGDKKPGSYWKAGIYKNIEQIKTVCLDEYERNYLRTMAHYFGPALSNKLIYPFDAYIGCLCDDNIVIFPTRGAVVIPRHFPDLLREIITHDGKGAEVSVVCFDSKSNVEAEVMDEICKTDRCRHLISFIQLPAGRIDGLNGAQWKFYRENSFKDGCAIVIKKVPSK